MIQISPLTTEAVLIDRIALQIKGRTFYLGRMASDWQLPRGSPTAFNCCIQGAECVVVFARPHAAIHRNTREFISQLSAARLVHGCYFPYILFLGYR